jgi:serine/threonine protein kinase
MTQCLNPDCLQVNQAQTKFCVSCGEKLVLRERYRPLKIIGQGGFGRTFQAVDEDKPSKPFCVIKQFFPQAQGTKNLEKAAKLFAQEAERLDGLGRHSQIPELLAYFTQDNRQYLVQEFIDGQNLKQELEESVAFSENQILELLKSLLPVLEFIHSQQIIHRDIKPENIIRRRKDNQLVLVDFGAAKYATMTALGRTGTVIGSAGYVAPEQSVGRASFVSDIYSLGVTCIHLLTKIEPFDLFDVSENDWVWRDYLQSNVSNECGKVLDKMIVGATKKRFQNVGEIFSVIQPTSQRYFQTPQVSGQRQRELERQLEWERGKRQEVEARLQRQGQVQPPVREPQSSGDVPLVSAVGVDYTKLRDLLVAKNWKEADLETYNRMLEVAGRKFERHLDIKDAENFPCQDLGTIDKLWVKYSGGKFGFSVQKQIYQDLGGTKDYDYKVWESFGDKIGWRKGGSWLSYSNLTFRVGHYMGHLPFPWHPYERSLTFGPSLFSRAETCRL